MKLTPKQKKTPTVSFSFRLEKEDADDLQEMIDKKFNGSRSDALREAIMDYIKYHS